MFAVLPFGNAHGHRDADRRPDADGVRQRLLAVCDPRSLAAPAGSRRSRASRSQFHCNGDQAPVIDGIWKAPERPDRHADAARPDRHRPVRHQRLHVHRRRRLHRLHARAPTCCRPGDLLLDVVIDYVAAHSPVQPGRRGADRRAVAASADPAAPDGRPPGRPVPIPCASRRSDRSVTPIERDPRARSRPSPSCPTGPAST